MDRMDLTYLKRLGFSIAEESIVICSRGLGPDGVQSHTEIPLPPLAHSVNRLRTKNDVPVNASESFASGVRSKYTQKYEEEMRKLQSEVEEFPGVTWADSHCHLESILARTWRGGSLPAVRDNEPLVDLPGLVALWPDGLEACVSNFVFRRESKPGFTAEWGWLEQNLHHFEAGSPISGRLWFTVGIHPHDAANWDALAVEFVRRHASHPKCVGIGECGLDLFKNDEETLQPQLTAFRSQIALAVELEKPLVVHTRLVTRANELLCLRTFEELLPFQHPVHVHCFSDSLEFALELCERWPNLRIGFTGSITFKAKDNKAQDLIEGLPLERLLIETDGPYMCPMPFRGQTAHPGLVHLVAKQIAKFKGTSLGEVLKSTRRSTKVVYGI